jgi:RimJ/RimL family protein N-acetyltransferase
MAVTAHVLRTERLDLVPLPAAAIEALLAGDRALASALVGVRLAHGLGQRSRSLLQLRLRDLQAMPGAAPWLLRVMALRTPERPMVGLVGFHGPPDLTGTAEVGYEVERAHRRRGYATEATAALTVWALREGGARRVVAGIRPENEASMRVVARLGFTPVGSRWDALDGTARLFERWTPPIAPRWEDAGTHRGLPRLGGPGSSPLPEAADMTDDSDYRDIYPDRKAGETRTIVERLRGIFAGHRADPADPEHRCLCGWDGENFDDHLADATLREMKDVGYEIWPVRH